MLGFYFCSHVTLMLILKLQVVHWAWHSHGWASPMRESSPLAGCGAADFAGSGVVHMVGGTAALVAARAVKARRGRFRPDGSVARLQQQSPALQTLGTLILWVGWCKFLEGVEGEVVHFNNLEWFCDMDVFYTEVFLFRPP